MDNRIGFFASMIFSRKVHKTVFRKQDFKIPTPKNGVYVGFEDKFKISPSYLNEWNEFLGSETAEKAVPYTYYWPWNMQWLMKYLLPQSGINLRNVLHMGHDAEFSENFHNIDKLDCIIKNSLLDICPLSKNKIDLVTQSIIETKGGEVLFKAKDHTIILNMREQDMELLRESNLWDFERVPFREDSFRKKESLFADSKNCDKSLFQCKNDIASMFGKVAGALSVTHANALASKFFRNGNVFLQGMCTGNIVMKVLGHELGEDIEKFDVYFTNQLVFPQLIEIRYNDSRFEVFDESNVMVAFGSRTRRNAKENVVSLDERKVA